MGSHPPRRNPPRRNPLFASSAAALLLVMAGLTAGVCADPIETANRGQPGAKVAPFELPAVDARHNGQTPGQPIVALGAAPETPWTVVCFLGAEKWSD